MAMVGGEGHPDGTESLEGFMTIVDNDDCRDFEDAETEEYEYREEE